MNDLPNQTGEPQPPSITTGGPQPLSITAEQYRTRIQYEDHLLYTRFNLVLVINGFAAVAVGFNQPIASKILLAIIMVLLNVLGTLAVWKTEWVIAALTRRYLKDYPDEQINKIVQEVLGKPGLLRPNQILCRIFPAVLTLGWICGLALGIYALVGNECRARKAQQGLWTERGSAPMKVARQG